MTKRKLPKFNPGRARWLDFKRMFPEPELPNCWAGVPRSAFGIILAGLPPVVTYCESTQTVRGVPTQPGVYHIEYARARWSR